MSRVRAVCGMANRHGRWPDGWVRVQVAGSDEPVRWYCSPTCAVRALGFDPDIDYPPVVLRAPALPDGPAWSGSRVSDAAVGIAILARRAGVALNLLSATPRRVDAAFARATAAGEEPDAMLLAAYDRARAWARPTVGADPVDGDETVEPEEETA